MPKPQFYHSNTTWNHAKEERKGERREAREENETGIPDLIIVYFGKNKYTLHAHQPYMHLPQANLLLMSLNGVVFEFKLR